MLTVLTTVFLANTVDYGELKNHRRDESVIFSMQTFVVKLASGVAALIASVCLWIFNISEDTPAAAGTASNTAVIGLRMTMTVIPVIGLVFAVFCIFHVSAAGIALFHGLCYNVTNDKMEEYTHGSKGFRNPD